jgi:hypothetical protein
MAGLTTEYLLHLHEIGFKIIPLMGDSKTPAVKSTNEIYNDPNYWTTEKIAQLSNIKNVATTFGKTHLRDSEGNDLCLHELDIDSKEAYDMLAVISVKNEDRFFIDEMCKLTYVVKTRKKYGVKIFWLSHKQHPPIGTRDCRPGFEFEIKSDNTLGHSTLPPSCHREDPNFHYHSIGKETIAIQDRLYDGILKVLSDCLRNKEPKCIQIKVPRVDSNANATNIILNDNDIEEAVCQIRDYCLKGSRQNLMLGLSGLLYKNGITLESAQNLLERLCHSVNDEEKTSRIAALRSTYFKGNNGETIAGSSLLLEVLGRYVDAATANNILQNITAVWRKYKNPVFGQLQDHVRAELQQHVVETLCYAPLVFVVAHSHKKQIVYAKIESRPLENDRLMQEEEADTR